MKRFNGHKFNKNTEKNTAKIDLVHGLKLFVPPYDDIKWVTPKSDNARQKIFLKSVLNIFTIYAILVLQEDARLTAAEWG